MQTVFWTIMFFVCAALIAIQPACYKPAEALNKEAQSRNLKSNRIFGRMQDDRSNRK